MIDGYDMYNGYVNGFLERSSENKKDFCGTLKIEGIDISPIHGMYFKNDGNDYLWIKRKPILEYEIETQSYKERERVPKWECYLKKTVVGESSMYVGTFFFLKFKYEIRGIWDSVLGKTERNRINFYIERLPMKEQTIINEINNMNKKSTGGGI